MYTVLEQIEEIKRNVNFLSKLCIVSSNMQFLFYGRILDLIRGRSEVGEGVQKNVRPPLEILINYRLGGFFSFMPPLRPPLFFATYIPK